MHAVVVLIDYAVSSREHGHQPHPQPMQRDQCAVGWPVVPGVGRGLVVGGEQARQVFDGAVEAVLVDGRFGRGADLNQL